MDIRAKSYFYKMRLFHNNIKRNLYNKYTKNTDTLLELAVGKAGDLNKWIDNHIKKVIGFDIDPESIKEAKNRVKDKKINVELMVLDLSKNVLHLPEKVDTVAAMFSFHYFFKTKDTFNCILQSTNNLKVNGYFIGCMFDADKVKELLSKNQHYDNFRIKKVGVFTNSLFGNKISVLIKDTVLDTVMIEYLVDFNKLVKVLETRGFKLIETKLFSQIYKNEHLKDQEKTLSFLNRTFVFKKIW
jgi:ubiquinone/menaquinone biosynthesis C-methylase UbiE